MRRCEGATVRVRRCEVATAVAAGLPVVLGTFRAGQPTVSGAIGVSTKNAAASPTESVQAPSGGIVAHEAIVIAPLRAFFRAVEPRRPARDVRARPSRCGQGTTVRGCEGARVRSATVRDGQQFARSAIYRPSSLRAFSRSTASSSSAVKPLRCIPCTCGAPSTNGASVPKRICDTGTSVLSAGHVDGIGRPRRVVVEPAQMKEPRIRRGRTRQVVCCHLGTQQAPRDRGDCPARMRKDEADVLVARGGVAHDQAHDGTGRVRRILEHLVGGARNQVLAAGRIGRVCVDHRLPAIELLEHRVKDGSPSQVLP